MKLPKSTPRHNFRKKTLLTFWSGILSISIHLTLLGFFTHERQQHVKDETLSLTFSTSETKQLIKMTQDKSPSPNKKSKFFSDKNHQTDNERILPPLAKNINPPKSSQKKTPSSRYQLLKQLHTDISQPFLNNSRNTPFYKTDLSDNNMRVPYGTFVDLNTTKLHYFSYYYRMKQKMEFHWKNYLGNIARRLIASNHNKLASQFEYVTAIKIILNTHGELIKMKMVKQSGSIELDAAALQSFKKAEPFPNPPKPLIQKDGLIRLQWTFIVST